MPRSFLTSALLLTAVLAQASVGAAETMQAAAIDRPGGPEVLTLHTVAVPSPGADEVLIAVNTAGVGPWDIDVRERLDDWKNRNYPLVLGVDGSGTVAAVGSTVRGFKIGDPVYAYVWDNPKGGFYAEYVAVAATAVGHVPAGMSLRDAGAGAVGSLTALQGIDDALHIKSGERLLIHGAGGSVGSLAVQFAKLRGARVLATASGDDGAAFVRGLGADEVVDGRHGDIRGAAHAFAPSGVDALLVLAGGDALEACMETLRTGARAAYPSGVHPEPKARNGITVVRYDAIAAPAQYARLNEAIVAARLKVPIAAEFRLADAAQAHERMAAGHVLGKVVLRVR